MILKKTHTQSVELKLYWLYPLQKGETHTSKKKSGVLEMTPNYIR